MSIILGITGTFEGYTTSPLYLFNNGTWSNLQTTGITMTAPDGYSASVSSSAGAISIAIRASGPYFTNIVRLNQTVNLTNYTYIKGLIYTNTKEGDGTVKICISSNSNVTSNSFTASSAASDTGTLICNIASITGSYYIYLYATCSNSGGVDYIGLKTLFLSNS